MFTTRQEAIAKQGRYVRTANGGTWDRLEEREVATVEIGWCDQCDELTCEDQAACDEAREEES